MAALQTIIDSCNGLTINRRKVVGQQITRNQIPRVSTTPTKNPWTMELDMPTSYKYSDARALMESVDLLDRTGYEDITFLNNACLSWMFRYQGSLPLSQLNGLTVSSFIGNQLVLSGLPPINANRVIFEPNDLIQIAGFPYPFTSTTQVTRGSGTTVQIITNRPNILTGSVVGNTLKYGNDCEFKMFCPNMPTYTLVPGGYAQSSGVTTNNALLSFSDDFNLYEWVATA